MVSARPGPVVSTYSRDICHALNLLILLQSYLEATRLPDYFVPCLVGLYHGILIRDPLKVEHES
jgi:hypothetical protein